jgi:hypothetical protein
MDLNTQIEEMVDRSLSWAGHHLDLFQAADAPDGRVQTTLKPLVELSLLCMLCRRHAEFDHDSRIRNMLAVSAETWSTRHGCDRLVRNPDAFRLHAIWHESLVHGGALRGEDRPIVQAVVDHGYVTATEEVGFRDLDLRHLLDLGGYRHHLPSYRSLYRQTVLGRGGPVLSFNHVDAYSVTHTLFYLSDFGARPLDAIPQRELPYVRWILEVLLGQYLLREDWDLVAELLLGAACVRWKPPDALCNAAWNGLIGAQRDDGAIPSRSFEEDACDALPEIERRAYAFEHSYHTTLAAAIAGFTVGRVPVRPCRSSPYRASSYRDSQSRVSQRRARQSERPSGQYPRRARDRHRDAPVEAARSEDWRVVAESAEAWLASLLRMDLSVQHALQILAGLWLTNHRGGSGVVVDIQPEPDTALAAATRRTTELLRAGDRAGDIVRNGVVGIDTGLLLCSAGILRSLGQPDADLEAFASRLGQHLPRPCASEDPDTTIQLASARHLLAALGYSSWIDPPGHLELTTLSRRIGSDLFRLDEPARSRLTTALLAASAFGHRPLQGLDEIRLAVPAWALASLQQNQLERGAVLLRASNSLCPTVDPSVAAGTAFLLMQQRTDGAFGFFGPERQRISELRPDLQPELDVTLPTTVAVLWCLAEVLTTDLRLYPAPDQ